MAQELSVRDASVATQLAQQQIWKTLYLECFEFAKRHADPACVRGLKQLGLSAWEVPTLERVGHALRPVDWRVLGVQGLISPRKFALSLAERVLPIVINLRPADKISFSPEPDLFHETFGHACQLFSPAYSAFLQYYGRLSAVAFAVPQDHMRAQFFQLIAAQKAKDFSFYDFDATKFINDVLSEREILARFGWWTFEVGLIGSASPKLFGAGLLSSPAESFKR